ncbi:tRNA pseudouridine38-40 synthase [Lewinella marina]|uniref:tRNA pseudouridine synthase A n=1 Tax=Neolewinella marina TaxID=438751 RepID=A0A2G0CEH4_9BACT|nr:tRNA pseudouridine synthase A [Neolewinella marina]NJB87304.1 tRNA pseudouridine38-40 synthase [Neolewinella marina]PHK98376.1 tRNA pseudouridine(38-40) synthase TruA [Neolewinella marina]
MHRYFVQLAYRGTHYRGWQRQSGDTVTVQGTIEAALARVQGQSGKGPAAGDPPKVVGCGRTDAGVHASDYYLHFDVEAPLRDNWLFIMNKLLPDDIVLYRVWPVAPGAHVRYDATGRTYDYYFHTRADPFLAPVSSYLELGEFDTWAMEMALRMLTGPHDFRAFCLTPDRHNTTTCELREASFHREGEGRYRFRFVADRFLRGMIRILVYQLLRVGQGELSPDELADALASGERISVGQAPPQGLFLSRVEGLAPG